MLRLTVINIMAETLVEGLETEWIFDLLFLPVIALINVFTGN